MVCYGIVYYCGVWHEKEAIYCREIQFLAGYSLVCHLLYAEQLLVLCGKSCILWCGSNAIDSHTCTIGPSDTNKSVLQKS